MASWCYFLAQNNQRLENLQHQILIFNYVKHLANARISGAKCLAIISEARTQPSFLRPTLMRLL
ncbi:hypothetical protein C2869_01255 [Saccharobesus litoralis]|uniref:Uncharacterized protein n=1 Tax=Saccharobesus litoralis TaxID=2172099 RepID=A0A2S0VLR9_9ALTE|nr:hypothetical protein C2869_01255 [Saccharobesus litoralis]